jgi:hypothetical protein
MLASLLPGVRHVRTPLIAGYLYFLAVWLLLGPDRLVPGAGGDTVAEHRLANAIDLAGRGGTLAALSVAAILLGSLVTIREWRAWPTPT